MEKFVKISFLSLFLLFILVPIILIFLGSLGDVWYSTILPTGLFTLKWYKTLLEEIMYLRAMKMSLLIGTLAVLGNILIGIPAVYAIYTSSSQKLKKLLDILVILPIAVPPLVIATGLIQFYNQKWLNLVGKWPLLLFAHLIFTLPFMIEPVHANLKLINWNLLDEAAESLGASEVYKFVRILIPNLLPGILSGALMVFTMSLGEFQLAVMLSGFRTQTYPVVLFQAFSRETGFACAATSVLIGVSVFSLFAITRVLKITRGEVRG